MHYVEFEEIEFKNLISYGNYWTKIPLNQFHTTMLFGKSGSGKTTILDGVTYCCYNRPYRKMKKIPQLINSTNGRELLIRLKLRAGQDKVIIERGQAPKVLTVNVNGEDIKAVNLDKYLEENILKMSFNTFKQVVAVGSKNFVPLANMEAKPRREIIEDIFSVKIFSVMLVLTKSKVSEINRQVQDLNEKKTNFEYVVTEQRAMITEAQKDNTALIEDAKLKIAECQDKVTELKEQKVQRIAEHKKLAAAVKDDMPLRIKRDEFISLETDYKFQINRCKKEIQHYKEYEICSECERPIDIDKRKQEIATREEKLAELEPALPKLQAAKEKVDAQLEVIRDAKNVASKAQMAISEVDYEITSQERMLKQWEENLRKLDKKQSFQDKEEKLKEYQQKLEAASTEIAGLERKKKIYTYVQGMLSDTGIKTEIIKLYMPKFNSIVTGLLSDMDFFITFHLDENFDEVVKSHGREDHTYENFSDGEQQRIDLAILFAQIAIGKMKSSINTNLLILDEILDSHLSAEAAENIVSIFGSDIFRNTNIFVVSHKENLQNRFENLITFEKIQDFSRIS